MKQRSLFENPAPLDDAQQDMTPKEKAFAYQVEVCEQIRREFPDAYFNRGFAWHDFSALDVDKDQWEYWERLKKDYPDAQPYFGMGFTHQRSEYGSGKIAGWRTIIDAQRRELERKG